jgi:hypothetical protein
MTEHIDRIKDKKNVGLDRIEQAIGGGALKSSDCQASFPLLALVLFGSNFMGT